MTKDGKPTSIAVFTREFLGISATFIYRQLLGVSGEFNPLVICSSEAHSDIFPYDKVYSLPSSYIISGSLFEKLTAKIKRGITGYYNYGGKKALEYWRGILASHNCRLIHAHFAPDAMIIAPVAHRLKIPLIVTAHGYDLSRLLKRRGYIKQLNKLFSQSSKIIAVSKVFQEKLISLGCPPEKTVLHYIGAPVNDIGCVERSHRDNEEIVFLQVSNFVEKKGHIFTLKAFADALKQGLKGRLVLAGDGTELNTCRQWVLHNNMGDQVDFLGRVSMNQALNLMSQADVFVHHSITAKDGDTEGIPTVIMEAMASCLPVISTNHAGIPELVSHDKSGFLTEERDVKTFTDKMMLLSKNSSLREAMGKQGRAIVEERFNIDKQNLLLKQIYHQMINEL